MTHRKQFLHQLWDLLGTYRYAVLKYRYKNIDAIPEKSDLDIVIEKKQLDYWKAVCKGSALTDRVVIVDRSHVSHLHIYFKDQSYLELDLIYAFERKTQAYLDPKLLLDRAGQNYEGVKTASEADNLEYILLFFGVNKAQIPLKHIAYYQSLPFAMQQKLLATVEDKYKTGAASLNELLESNLMYQQRFEEVIQSSSLNSPMAKFKRSIRYVKDTLSHPAPVITFTGVDGAGKSTVLEAVESLLSEKYRRNTLTLRHRPSLLPILSSFKYGKAGAEKRAATGLPRQGQNKSKLSSMLRFTYYYTDYLLGQLYIYLRYSLRGYIVLYDRYYFDFIIDPLRTNIRLDSKLTRSLYKWIYKPRLNILLYAAPEVVRQRKQELDVEQITELTQGYRELFGELSVDSDKATYLPIQNHDLDKTLTLIENQLVKVI